MTILDKCEMRAVTADDIAESVDYAQAAKMRHRLTCLVLGEGL